MIMNHLVTVDSRHRASLGKLGRPGGKYLAREHEDGTIILEPAVITTRAQQWMDARPDMQQIVKDAVAGRAKAVKRERPRRKTPRRVDDTA